MAVYYECIGLVTDRVSEEGNRLRSSVCLFPLDLLNCVTFDLDLLYVYGYCLWVHHRSILLPSCVYDLLEILHRGQREAKVRSGEEILLKASTL